MSKQRPTLYEVLERIVPQAVELRTIPEDVALRSLGFDSMAIVALFVELENTFGFPLEQLQIYLTKACTLGNLLQLFSAVA